MKSLQRKNTETINWIANQIEGYKNPVAITLTLKSPIERDFEKLRSTYQHQFLRRLNRACYGNAAKRYGRVVQILAVAEESPEVNLHVHCIADRPSHISQTDFATAVKASWKLGFSDVRKAKTPTGWVDYMIKEWDGISTNLLDLTQSIPAKAPILKNYK